MYYLLSGRSKSFLIHVSLHSDLQGATGFPSSLTALFNPLQILFC